MTARPRRPLRAGRWRPVTAVVAERRLCLLVDQGCVRHTLLQAAGGRALGSGPEQEVGDTDQEVRQRAAGGEVEGDQRTLPACRPGSVGRRLHREVGTTVHRLPRQPQSPAQGDRLRQRLGEGWGEAQDAPAPADEVEARDVAGEHGRVTFRPAQLDPGAQQHPWDPRSKPGGQDDRVTQGALAQEHGGCTLSTGPGRLRPQPGRVMSPEEPSFHGEAG